MIDNYAKHRKTRELRFFQADDFPQEVVEHPGEWAVYITSLFWEGWRIGEDGRARNCRRKGAFVSGHLGPCQAYPTNYYPQGAHDGEDRAA